jgi:hypothetical protein
LIRILYTKLDKMGMFFFFEKKMGMVGYWSESLKTWLRYINFSGNLQNRQSE